MFFNIATHVENSDFMWKFYLCSSELFPKYNLQGAPDSKNTPFEGMWWQCSLPYWFTDCFQTDSVTLVLTHLINVY